MDAITAFISEHWIPLAIVAAGIVLAGLFAAAETAIVFSNKARLHQLADEGNARAERALRLVLARNELHSALLLTENFFLILAVAVSTALVLQFAASVAAAVAITSVFLTVIVVLFSKLAPKALTFKNPDRLALAFASPLMLLMKALSPVTHAVSALADLLAGPTPAKGMSCTAIVTEEDIKAMINLGGEEGSLKEEEKELLHKVFEFGDTVASEAMRPRTEIVSVPSDARIQAVLSLVSEYGYSRYPVIENTVDTVIGILYIKDILVAMSAGEIRREDGIQRYIRPANFIPENKRVSELLAEMQREKFQIAIVIDEYGGTAGLVTLEDLIEEIVGSIHDELETEQKDVEIVDEKNFVVSGQSELDEINEMLDIHLQSNDFNTIGGFVFGLFGRMPKIGEQLKYKDLKFEILEIEERKISKIKITKQ